MDPVTLTAISVGATVAGGATGALGSLISGDANQKMYQYQAAVAKMNQQIAKQNAGFALATGEVQAQQMGMKTRAVIGQTKADQGASGLDVNSGSTTKVRESEAEVGAEDAATIRSNAARKAYGYEVTAAQDEAQGKLDIMAGENAKTSGEIGAFSSILGAVGSVSSKWLTGTQQGIFGGNQATNSGGQGILAIANGLP